MEQAKPDPTGTVTFLFTDTEGSTVLWERDRVAMKAAVARQLAMLRIAAAAYDGGLVTVVGDVVPAAVPPAPQVVAASVANPPTGSATAPTTTRTNSPV
jgi:class 3 adenylate cyclase